MKRPGLASAVTVLGALALGGCVTAPDDLALTPLAEAPHFDPFTFFAGTSAGTGTLSKLLADPATIRVASSGRVIEEVQRQSSWAVPPRRVLVLDQVVAEGDKPPRSRQWRIHEVAPGRYEGTLADAISPITGRVEGNRLTLRFTMKGGFAVRQELTLSADARRADNVMTVTKLGVTVAVLVEDIRRD